MILPEGQQLRGAALEGDAPLEVDVCVVGSGAGGAVSAARLAARGQRVLILEAGPSRTRADFDMHEATAYPALYQDQAGRATHDQAVTLLQGRGVGGGTTINWTTCFRTPPALLKLWAGREGVEGLSPELLAPHFEAVEARLNIAPWPVERANPNNDVLWRGAQALGWSAASTRRNVRGCMNTGYCGLGCPVDAKQGMHLTYLADALAQGATLLSETEVVRVVTQGRRVIELEALAAQPGAAPRRLRVRPKLTVLAGGAINTPALLLRSELNGNDQVGRRTFLHPVSAVAGVYEGYIEPYYGAPQSIYSHHFIERGPDKVGFFFEAAPLHPVLGATALGGDPQTHQALLERLPHISALIALAVDGLLPGDRGGRITLRRDGRIKIDYPLTPPILEALTAGMQRLCEIHLAAGALEARPLTHALQPVRGPADIEALAALAQAPARFPVFSAHQMGGACMGEDPSRSVVNSRLRHHTLDNLYIIDGSVLPTALGVNPSETLYGLAHWAAGALPL